MAKKLMLLSVLLLSAGLLLSGCGIYAGQAEGQELGDPTKVVDSFYHWYLESMEFDVEAGGRGRPSDEDLEARAELSNELLSRRLEVLASFNGVGSYDPLICAQDVPTEFRSELVESSDQEALVRVQTSFEGHSFNVRLVQAESWQIAEVICNSK